MAAARFQVVSVTRAVRVPAPREPDGDGGSRAALPLTREAGFTWRFMSANNRSLAKSAQIASDVDSCLETIRILRESLSQAVGETSRNGSGQWIWRVRLDGEVIVTATRSYPREIRARMTCDAFILLVATTPGSAPVQVMYR